MQQKIGLIFGKFYPLHLGHVYLIEKASVQVDILHVFIGVEAVRDELLFKNSQLPKQPTNQDRFDWLHSFFKQESHIKIHILDEAGIEFYPNGWQDWSNKVKKILTSEQIQPTTIFTSEPQDKELHEQYFNVPVTLIDVNRDFIPISATKIRSHLYQNWLFLPPIVQHFFSQSVAIVIKNPHLAPIVKKLATIFNTTCADLRNQKQNRDKPSVNFSIQPFSLYLIEQHQKIDFDEILEFNMNASNLELFNEGIQKLKKYCSYPDNSNE